MNRPGAISGTGGGGIGVDPFRHEEVLSEGDFLSVIHDWQIPPGTAILFDSGGHELEVAWHDDLAGGTTQVLFNGSLTEARIILEANPAARHLELFSGSGSFLVQHDLGRIPSSVLLYDGSGHELEAAWRNVGVDQTWVYFNGTVTDATAIVEGQETFRHDETISGTISATYRIEHGFGVSPGSVVLFDDTGYEAMVAWQDDGVGEVIDIFFNGTLTNPRVVVSAVEEDVTASDYYMEVARGNVAGHSTFRVEGINLDVGTGVSIGEVIWNVGGTFNDLSAAQTIDLVSDAATDDVGSTGAEKVTIYGLDASYELQEEEVDMDGTTPVTSTLLFLFVNSLKATQVGGSGRNAGVITAEGNTDNNTIAKIGTTTAGDGASLSTLYMVPLAHTLYVHSIEGGLPAWTPDDTKASFSFYTQEDGATLVRQSLAGTCINGSSHVQRIMSPPIAVPAKTLIFLFAETSVDNTYVHGAISGVLVAD